MGGAFIRNGPNNRSVITCARFEVSMAVKIHVIWIVMPCSVVVGYQRF
jgi:hypothetical protein